ncbi:MAG: hypothetical protein K0R94_1090, partial [Burkholderiales bacterium]|nr:hypothetical protein [Burkholderiales bacterium]
MQINNPKNNTSNLIKQTESAKKKARRRLIGSIFLLFTALIILLNVTKKVKPIPVNPKVIEINSNASSVVKASGPIKQSGPVASAPITASSPVTTSVINTEESQGNGFRAGVINRDDNTNKAEADTSVTIKPIIITMNIGRKLSPEEILNGVTTSTSEIIYYIQIAASPNKSGLQTIQKNMDNNGIQVFI